MLYDIFIAEPVEIIYVFFDKLLFFLNTELFFFAVPFEDDDLGVNLLGGFGGVLFGESPATPDMVALQVEGNEIVVGPTLGLVDRVMREFGQMQRHRLCE